MPGLGQFSGTVPPIVELRYSHFGTPHGANVIENLALRVVGCLLSVHAYAQCRFPGRLRCPSDDGERGHEGSRHRVREVDVGAMVYRFGDGRQVPEHEGACPCH